MTDLHGTGLPKNVRIVEFFLDPGALLNVGHSQRHYVSSNYTHVARDVAAQGVNVIAQLVAKRSVEGRAEYSLGSNPDVTLDLLEQLAPQRRAGRDIVVIGETNRQMPFMFGPAAVAAETFDALIEHPRYDYDLFAPPNRRLDTADYAIGLYAAHLGRAFHYGAGPRIVLRISVRHRLHQSGNRAGESAEQTQAEDFRRLAACQGLKCSRGFVGHARRGQALSGAHVLGCPENPARMALATSTRAGIGRYCLMGFPADCFSTPG